MRASCRCDVDGGGCVVAVLVFRRATCYVGLRQAKVVPTSTAWVWFQKRRRRGRQFGGPWGGDGSETVGGSVCAATEVGDGSGKTSGWLLESEGAGMEGGSSRDGGDWRGGSERQAAGDGIN